MEEEDGGMCVDFVFLWWMECVVGGGVLLLLLLLLDFWLWEKMEREQRKEVICVCVCVCALWRASFYARRAVGLTVSKGATLK